MGRAKRFSGLFRSRIFRRQFLWFLAVIAGLSVAFAAAIGLTTRAELSERQRVVAELYRDQLKGALQVWLDSRVAAVRTFAHLIGQSESSDFADASMTDRLAGALKPNPDFRDILLIGADGNIRNSTVGPPAAERADVSDREYFTKAIAGGLGITGFFVGRNTGRQVMTIAARSTAADGAVFVAAAFIALDRFSEVMGSLSSAGIGEAYLVGADARRLSGDVHAKTAPPNPAAEGAAAGGTGAQVFRGPDGKPRLGAYARIDELDAGLVVEMRKELFMEPVERLQRVAFLIGAIGAVLAAGAALVLTARQFRPIDELIRAVDGVAASDYSRSVGATGADELGSLIERFNRMRELIAERESSLRDDASRDSLTGLYNHGAVMAFLQNAAELADGRKLCFSMIDIDHFKRINDEYGHQAGDSVLRELAQLLRSAVRGEDMVGRYGGEEFVVVLRERNEDANRAFCERLRERIERAEFVHDNRRMPVTVSIGWACANTGPRFVPKRLIGKADEALYRAKRAGRNRVEQG